MGVDIIIGEHTATPSPLLFRCLLVDICPGTTCEECGQDVRQEERKDSPYHQVATPQGAKEGGYNFDSFSYGFWARLLEETGIDQRYPVLNFKEQPSVAAIPDGLGAALHRLATDVELGIVQTKYPVEDAQVLCWMAWWCNFATQTYGERAAISFG